MVAGKTTTFPPWRSRGRGALEAGHEKEEKVGTTRTKNLKSSSPHGKGQILSRQERGGEEGRNRKLREVRGKKRERSGREESVLGKDRF